MNYKTEIKLDQAFIDDVCTKISANKRVHRPLPNGGYVRIDRQLPFLCVYRIPDSFDDAQTARLVRGEAAYMVIPSKHFKSKYKLLLEKVIETQSAAFGKFLLLEIWAGSEVEKNEAIEPEAVRPIFNIFADSNGDLISTCESLEAGLQKIKVLKKKAHTFIHYVRNTRPQTMKPLITKSRLLEMGCYSLGLEVLPIYRNVDSHEVFPLVFRSIHNGVSKALKQAFFDFTRYNTHHNPPHYSALGPRAITKPVFAIDHQLAAISASYDFLLLATPISQNKNWLDFKRHRFDRPPVFHYRPLPIDPAHLKKKLYAINLDRIADPAIGLLFRQKREEIDRELTMLAERGSKNFFFSSLQLYGRVDEQLMKTALEILAAFSGRSRDDTFKGSHKASEFAARAQAEIDRYQEILGEKITSEVVITDEVSGLMCNKGNMLVGSTISLPDNRVEALIQHEVGTHILTYINGKSQPFQLLSVGLNGYDELQEGLAVLSEYLVGQLNRSRMRLLAGRVVAARYIDDGASFVETFRMLKQTHGFEQQTAYRITVRIYRSGGLVKDAIYLRGLVQLLGYLAREGDVNLLFSGKFAYDHIPTMQELMHRGVLRPPKILPLYLNQPNTIKRLQKLRKRLSLIELVK